MITADPAVLRVAAGVIRTGGHAQHAYHNGTAYCLVGAVLKAKLHRPTESVSVVDLPQVEPELEALAELIGAPSDLLTPFGAVTDWNDAPNRTIDEVLALLEQAAQKVEANR